METTVYTYMYMYVCMRPLALTCILRSPHQIQRAWRGYYVRKYVFDYHAQKQYLSELRKKNEAVRQRLAEYQMREESERAAREERVMEVCERGEGLREEKEERSYWERGKVCKGGEIRV